METLKFLWRENRPEPTRFSLLLPTRGGKMSPKSFTESFIHPRFIRLLPRSDIDHTLIGIELEKKKTRLT